MIGNLVLKWRILPLISAFVLVVFAFPALALEIRGTVKTVGAGNEVRIDLPAGASAAIGDEVRIEAILPGIGPVAIQTRWHVAETGPGYALALPDGEPSGTPQAGYAALITTSAAQGSAVGSADDGSSPKPDSAPVRDCDRLAASPLDPAAIVAGVPREQVQTEKAIQACRQAVQEFPESPRFAFQLARSLEIAGDVDAAFSGYRKAADLGSAAAMNNLASCYGKGSGTPQNPREALTWYRRAADQGLTIAMLNLAAVYERGEWVEKDLRTARKWLRQAAEKGDSIAMLRLGRMARSGIGTNQDPQKAARWFRMSADAGNAEAMYILGALYNVGFGVSQDERKAVEWYRKAGKAGHVDAMVSLAQAYDRGQGVAQSQKDAAEWYRRAANAGSVAAMYNLAGRYREGLGIGKDYSEAASWFQKAADKGITAANYELAIAYEDGKGVPQNSETAAAYMFRAPCRATSRRTCALKTPSKVSS
jgi:TPR repeat protein